MTKHYPAKSFAIEQATKELAELQKKIKKAKRELTTLEKKIATKTQKRKPRNAVIGTTRKGDAVMGLDWEGKEKMYTAKNVTLPNGKTLALFHYVPDGYTVSGKYAAYNATSYDNALLKKNESDYRRGKRHF